MSKPKTINEFLQQANKIHNNKYDYSLVIKSSKVSPKETKIDIICHHHGTFRQMVCAHLKGQGCKHCSDDKQRKYYSPEHVNELLDLSRIEYINLPDKISNQTKITFRCKLHNSTEQSTKFINHINNKHKCKFCGYEHLSKTKLPTKDDFIQKAINVHGNKYDYSKVEYSGNKTKVIITCKVHGEFHARPDNHINSKSGCPKCALETRDRGFISSQEIKIQNWLLEHNIEFIASDRKQLNGYELDLFLPEHNIAIEVNGIYWHSTNKFNLYDAHLFKLKLCESKGIRLLQFYDIEIDNSFEFVKTIILNTINRTPCPDKVLNRRFYSILDYPEYHIIEPSLDKIKNFDIWNPGYITNEKGLAKS